MHRLLVTVRAQGPNALKTLVKIKKKKSCTRRATSYHCHKIRVKMEFFIARAALSDWGEEPGKRGVICFLPICFCPPGSRKPRVLLETPAQFSLSPSATDKVPGGRVRRRKTGLSQPTLSLPPSPHTSAKAIFL